MCRSLADPRRAPPHEKRTNDVNRAHIVEPGASQDAPPGMSVAEAKRRLRQGRAARRKGKPRSLERSGFFIAAPVQGRDHSNSQIRAPRQMAFVHTPVGCDGQRSGVATVVLPRVGLRGDVLHLRFLLSGAGLLRRALPAESATATTAGRQPAAPAKPGRTARSPRPATGLSAAPPPGPRDGYTFPFHLRLGQYHGSGAFPVRKRTGKRLRGGSICRLPRIRTRLYHLRPHPQGNPYFVRGADNQEREKP